MVCQIDQEMIELQTNTEEGVMSIAIGFTSPLIQQQDKCESEEFLSKRNCLNALYSIHSTRWFQVSIKIKFRFFYVIFFNLLESS